MADKIYVNLRVKEGKQGKFMVGTSKKENASYFVFKDEKGASVLKRKLANSDDLEVIDTLTPGENDYGVYERGKDSNGRAYFLSANPKAGKPAFYQDGTPVEFDGRQVTEADYRLSITV